MRFYLHLVESGTTIPDEYGLDFAGPAPAHAYAVTLARRAMALQVKAGRLDLSGSIEIESEDGAVRDSVRFADAIKIRGAEALRRSSSTGG